MMPNFDRLFESMVWHNAIKASHRFDVQESDTTMIPLAASSPGQ